MFSNRLSIESRSWSSFVVFVGILALSLFFGINSAHASTLTTYTCEEQFFNEGPFLATESLGHACIPHEIPAETAEQCNDNGVCFYEYYGECQGRGGTGGNAAGECSTHYVIEPVGGPSTTTVDPEDPDVPDPPLNCRNREVTATRVDSYDDRKTIEIGSGNNPNSEQVAAVAFELVTGLELNNKNLREWQQQHLGCVDKDAKEEAKQDGRCNVVTTSQVEKRSKNAYSRCVETRTDSGIKRSKARRNCSIQIDRRTSRGVFGDVSHTDCRDTSGEAIGGARCAGNKINQQAWKELQAQVSNVCRYETEETNCLALGTCKPPLPVEPPKGDPGTPGVPGNPGNGGDSGSDGSGGGGPTLCSVNVNATDLGGGSARIDWSAGNVNSCSGSSSLGDATWDSHVFSISGGDGSGSVTITPDQSTTYALSCGCEAGAIVDPGDSGSGDVCNPAAGQACEEVTYPPEGFIKEVNPGSSFNIFDFFRGVFPGFVKNALAY